MVLVLFSESIVSWCSYGCKVFCFVYQFLERRCASNADVSRPFVTISGHVRFFLSKIRLAARIAASASASFVELVRASNLTTRWCSLSESCFFTNIGIPYLHNYNVKRAIVIYCTHGIMFLEVVMRYVLILLLLTGCTRHDPVWDTYMPQNIAKPAHILKMSGDLES